MKEYKIHKNIASKVKKFWLLIILSLGAIATSALSLSYVASLNSQQSNTNQAKTQVAPKLTSITALGRIEPEGEVIQVSATVPLEGAILEQLLVQEGDLVKKGQKIAVLDSYQTAESDLSLARQQLQVAKARLARVKAGAQTGTIQAQLETVERFRAELEGQIRSQNAKIDTLKARLAGEKETQKSTIERIEAQLANSRAECNRANILYQDGAISTSSRDQTCLEQTIFQEQLQEARSSLRQTVNSLTEELEEAKANLNRTIATTEQQIRASVATLSEITEVRPVDVAVAQAEVDEANAIVKQAENKLDLASVTAPVDGQIIRINTQAGESIDSSGILELAPTKGMQVIAEVYKTDIEKVRLGQKTIITSDAFSEKLQGTVKHIGATVQQQNVFSNQPGADVDRKVFEVKVELDPKASQKVKNLLHLQVQVAIKR